MKSAIFAIMKNLATLNPTNPLRTIRLGQRIRFSHGLLLFILLFASMQAVHAWQGGATPRLHVEGRYLCDPHGNRVNLHGVALTPSPWFNGGHVGVWRWNNYDIAGCLSYNKAVMSRLTDTTAGWYLNYIRLHMDPYWTNKPGVSVAGEHDISAFSLDRLKTYLTSVYIPLIKHAQSRGLYIIMRPPGVCPEKIAVGDAYHQYLLNVWGTATKNAYLKGADHVMLELANEPVQILGTDGTWGSNGQAHFDALKQFFQPIVDTIRANGFRGVLWIPGLGWQSHYKGYAINPIEDGNCGYAVHVYPGYWGGINNYAAMKKGWDEHVKPVADFAPIAVTEIDWAPEGYGSFGKATTGVAGGDGFGANFKMVVDASDNVSWNVLSPENLIHNGNTSGDIAYNSDPEACALPCYNWFRAYANSRYARPDYTYRSFSDKGDGTYTNPVIFGDFPDPDVVRVGDTYYMVSTTMHIFPGATILASNDLVNWRYCSNPLTSIEATPCYNLEGCSRYGHGQWASSLAYKDGTFHLLFTTLDEGSYLMTATDPQGAWTKRKLNDTFYDPALFFDEDGSTYVAYGINTLRIAQLDADFNKLPGKDQVVFTYTFREGLEGSHLYKINGEYYLYATYGGWPAFQVALRAPSIYGPYEEKVVLSDDNIHQGALIQTQTGEWWTLLFYDKGPFGRLPNLQPLTWENGWPMVGVNGKGVVTYRKPNVGATHQRTALPTNDNFRHYTLGLQWGWNHNQDKSGWSLTARPGFLRLTTIHLADSLPMAKNTLTQRILGYPSDLSRSYGTIKLHIKQMKPGDVAGLAVYQDPYAYLAVSRDAVGHSLRFYNSGAITVGPSLSDTVVYLRAIANYSTGKAHFLYSLDNQVYTPIGDELLMRFNLSVFTGNKFALFHYATSEMGGQTDIDWFSTEPEYDETRFYDPSFTGFSEEALTLTGLEVPQTALTLLTGSTYSLSVKAVYANGRREDISLGATYVVSDSSIIHVVNGRLMARKDGQSTVTIGYKGPLGHQKTVSLQIKASTFPLTASLFNPSIYASGTFNEQTKTLVTGQYGFGGWVFDQGVNLSDYRFLVAKLGADNTGGVSFRVFDENNYWTGAAQYDFGTTRRVVVTLSNMYRSGTSTKLDPSHIYIVGFWSFGNSPIVIDNVYLTNNTNYEPPVGLEYPATRVRPHERVDVYTIMGVRVRTGVVSEEAVKGLPPGLYLVGRQKVLVTH